MIKPINQVVTFIKEARDELKKVTWPERDEITSNTIVVIVAVVVVSVFLWVVDTSLTTLMKAVMY
ncbi:MAG: preprotein translocase subunit SecE [Spirochaetes bacterium]|nr:preprotein translocase subunit SecE [Spirochaetota bacterium]